VNELSTQFCELVQGRDGRSHWITIMPAARVESSRQNFRQQAGKDNKIQSFGTARLEVTDIALFDSEGLRVDVVRVRTAGLTSH